MIDVELRINGKCGIGKVNPDASVLSIKKHIAEEFEINADDYWISISNKDESKHINNLFSSGCIVYMNRKVVIDKDSFVDIKE